MEMRSVTARGTVRPCEGSGNDLTCGNLVRPALCSQRVGKLRTGAGTVPGRNSEGHLERLELSLGIGVRIPQVSMWRFTLSRNEAQEEALSQHP